MLRRNTRLFTLLCALVLVGLLAGLGLPLLPLVRGHAQSDAPPVELNEETLKRATVFVMQTYQNLGEPIISCIGSGTLVSADGLILTNAHTALSSDTCRSDRLVVAVTVRLDEPPVPTYTAEVVNANLGTDLAVLRINGYLDGRLITAGTLQLPYVTLGDSSTVSLDDTITIIGYPTMGDDPVSVARGTVSGFTAEARMGDHAWIRSSVVVQGTMSGGGAYDRNGTLIGIPTIAPLQPSAPAAECRSIQDTNQDGRIDRTDGCVPVGGFISALRPAGMARGMIRAAALGIRQGENAAPTTTQASDAQPSFSRLFFSTRVNEADQPANVVSSVPSGTTSLYLFFDYDNMTDGTVYELRVTIDENTSDTYSLPATTWSGGGTGLWYIGSASMSWPNGVYFFRLFIEGREAASQSITVGGSAQENPAFSDLVFGLPNTDQSALEGTNYVLPEGSAVQARFNYRSMQPGTAWTYRWFYGRQEIARGDESWDGDVQGTRIITAAADFIPGQYRLELYLNNTLSATADFVIAGGASGTSTTIFDDFRFSTENALSTDAAIVARTEFQSGISALYAFFDWHLMAPGTLWTRRWTVDSEVMYEVTEPWTAPSDGENFFVSLTSDTTLPDATYGLEIWIANVQLLTVTARVGLGQLPVDTFASAEGVQMSGHIYDAETGQGVPGAMFIVLEPEFSVEDFTWDQTQVLGSSMADSEGRFQIPVLLPRGTEDEPVLYSVLVQAEGYLPVSADGIEVNDTTPSPVDLTIRLTRR
ncbi:trypsin-like peptidase domain-containing protein [Aggregatilinea lenta]|uniref:trypsin-like peptidase domain-containing protein n=1 Tax=Aggregatilinea lenta TaxID=913108 RepID=UPI0013C2F9C2|nr:trypsin-like peptidase domain-containing protein [Aggregatilinea lenta]